MEAFCNFFSFFLLKWHSHLKTLHILTRLLGLTEVISKGYKNMFMFLIDRCFKSLLVPTFGIKNKNKPYLIKQALINFFFIILIMCSEISFHIILKEDFLKTESVYFYYYLFFKKNFSILFIF